jgi:transposase InsO family protein
MREVAQARPRYGYRRVHVLLRREGWQVNMKRVRRLYRLEGLQLRHRVRRRKHASLHRGIPPAASRAHERWSMDFSMVRSAWATIRFDSLGSWRQRLAFIYPALRGALL